MLNLVICLYRFDTFLANIDHIENLKFLKSLSLLIFLLFYQIEYAVSNGDTLSMDAHFVEKKILRIMVQTQLSVPHTRKIHRNRKFDGRDFLLHTYINTFFF